MGKSKPGPLPSAKQKTMTLKQNCSAVLLVIALTLAVPAATILSLTVR